MKEWWRIELAQHIKDGIVVGEEGGDLRDLGEGLRQGGRINDAKMEEAVIMIWLMFSLPLLTSRAYFHSITAFPSSVRQPRSPRRSCTHDARTYNTAIG